LVFFDFFFGNLSILLEHVPNRCKKQR
jgi:hypothetical protein